MGAVLVILAAGLGSRFGGGLKQMEPVGRNDEIIADFSVFDAKRVGFSKAVFVIKRENERLFHERVISRISKCFNVDYVFQDLDDVPEGFNVPPSRVKPWGTGHAILCARHTVKENFAVINADDFYGADAFKKLRGFLSGGECAEGSHCMVAFLLKNTVTRFGSVSRGICSVKDGYLSSIKETLNIKQQNGEIFTEDGQGERQPLNGASAVSMNIMGFHKSAMKDFESGFARFINNNILSQSAEFYWPSVAGDMINAGQRMKVMTAQDKWHGMTYKEDTPHVVSEIGKMIDAGIYPENLWEMG